METKIFNNAELLAQAAAEQIANLIEQKPNALLCLAGGETPALTYQNLVRLLKQRAIDHSRLQFVSLDEWIGIPGSNKGSCFYFLQEHIFLPLEITAQRIHFFDSMAIDALAECSRIDQVIQDHGGLDLMLVGVGMNGHVGFNEPGTDPGLNAHVVQLDAITTQVGQKYFSSQTPLSRGITLGIAQFMRAGMAIVLASGSRKAAILQQAMQAEISSKIPASFIRNHANGFLMIDKEAASLLDSDMTH